LAKRKFFEDWKVTQVYLAQEGVCARCGASLEHGFHRHHKDGDPSNNSIDNLELLCPKCHMATLGRSLEEHREQERKVLDALNRLIEEIFQGKISGALADKAIDAIRLSLRVSRQINELDEGLESPPASIMLVKRLQESKILMNTYLEGWKQGFQEAWKFFYDQCYSRWFSTTIETEDSEDPVKVFYLPMTFPPDSTDATRKVKSE